MNEKSGIRNWRNWIPPLLLVVVAAATVLSMLNGSGGSVGFADSAIEFAKNVLFFCYAVVFSGGAALLVIALSFQQRRLRPLAMIALVFLMFRVIYEGFYYFGAEGWRASPQSLVYIGIAVSSTIMNGLVIILLTLLPRLGKSGWILRIVLIASMAVVLIFHVLIGYLVISSNVAFLIIRMAAAAMALVSLAWIAYLACFRAKPAAHVPPVDAAGAVQLTCPRCQTAQTIPTDGGRCGNCRLDIFIALKEGTCRKCHYPLRGLTTAVCPECGTSVAEGMA